MKNRKTIKFLWETHQQNYRCWLCISAGVSEATVSSYISDLRIWLNFLETHTTSLLGEEGLKQNVVKYIVFRGQNKTKQTTLIRILSSIRSFFTYLIHEGVLEDTSLLELGEIKKQNYLPKVLTWLQIQSLVKAANNSSLESSIIKILVFLGLRVSELIGLRYEDWNFEKKTLLVMGKGARERIIPVPKDLWKVFNKGTVLSGWMFPGKKKGTHLTRMTVWNIVQTVAKRCNFAERIHPHIFRHSLATHLLEGGMDIFYIKELLGHADISSTEIYTHVRPDGLKNLLQKYHPLYS